MKTSVCVYGTTFHVEGIGPGVMLMRLSGPDVEVADVRLKVACAQCRMFVTFRFGDADVPVVLSHTKKCSVLWAAAARWN